MLGNASELPIFLLGPRAFRPHPKGQRARRPWSQDKSAPMFRLPPLQLAFIRVHQRLFLPRYALVDIRG